MAEETKEARAERHSKEKEKFNKDWAAKSDEVRKKVEEVAATHLKHMNDNRDALQKLLEKHQEENKKAEEATAVAA